MRASVVAGIAGILIGIVLAMTVPAARTVVGTVTGANGSFVNPVIGTDFADPTILRAADGWWYAYSTEQLTVERMANVQAARSRDLVNWELLPDALPVEASWAAENRDVWAPGAIQAPDGRAYLYFAALANTDLGMCLGVAVADSPADPFTDIGEPLQCGTGFVNIDAMPFDDPISGRSYLYWGSDGSPIYARELAEDRTRFAAGSEAVAVLEPDPDRPYEGLIEAPWVHVHDGTYYLFYSGDDCCSWPDPGYAVMVARADSPLGPFKRRGPGNQHIVLEASERWEAPGHNAVAVDDAGRTWLVYHAIDSRKPYQPAIEAVRRPMLIDPIEWVDGWPTVAGRAPSEGAAPRPAGGSLR